MAQFMFVSCKMQKYEEDIKVGTQGLNIYKAICKYTFKIEF